MNGENVDRILDDAAAQYPEPGAGLLNHIAASITSSPQPVRPLPPSWFLVTALSAVCVSVALAGAVFLGLHGIVKMNGTEIGTIFPVLIAAILVSATVLEREMVPGSPRRVAPAALFIGVCGVLLALFGTLFHEYTAVRFLSQGIACLKAGVLHAIPAGIVSWLILRRGVALRPRAAALASGTLAGLAGITMLELHCPIFEAPHILLWHTAVLPVSGALAAITVRWWSRRSR